MANQGFGSFKHLALRFFGALDPRSPDAGEEAWALGWLLPGEQSLWGRMSGPDRRHAAGVAREAAGLLSAGGGPAAGREVMAAALLHDVGKIESGLGTFARVGVTLAAIAVGRERLVGPGGGGLPGSAAGGLPGPSAGGLPGPSAGWRRRAGQYLTHDQIGADLLRAAGSDGLTIAWAAEHHLPPSRWTVERRVADALKAADGD